MKQGWKTCKFADVFNLQMGKTPSRDNPTYWGDDNMWVSIADMNEQKYMSATKEGITDIAVQESGIKPIPQGTVIMSFKLSIGKVSIATSKLYTNEAIMGFIEKEKGTLVPEYLYYYLKGYKWEGANKAAMGMTLNKKTIADNTISYPPIAEQEKIVAELDCLSGIIEKKKQQLKELDNLAQSIFYEMFGDPVENDKGWEKKRLDEIGKVITGNTPSTKDESNYSSADYCFVKPSDIAKDSISYISNTEFYVSEKAYINSRQLPKGSVLTTCIGIIGKVGILQKDATCNQQINAIIPNKDIDAKFLAHVLFMIRDVLTDVANAPIVPIINKKEFSSVSIPVPLFSLQQDFASKIESIEKQKELIAQSIKETETLFNSRMDYYFN